MNRLVVGLVSVFMFIGVHAEELLIAMEGKFPPFEELDSKGNLRGFNVDVANALCEEMKVKCKLVRFDWDDLIPALNKGKADIVLASMPITAERKKLVEFTEPYAIPPAHFIGNPHKFPYVRIEPRHMEGLKIGVAQDTTYDRYLSARFEKSTIVRFANTLEMYDALSSGKLDAVLDDGVVAYVNFLQTPKGKGFSLIGAPIKDTHYLGEGLGIAVKLHRTELRDKLNSALSEITDSGLLRQVAQKYFVFSVY